MSIILTSLSLTELVSRNTFSKYMTVAFKRISVRLVGFELGEFLNFAGALRLNDFKTYVNM